MTDDELRDFVAEQMIVNVATVGPHGRPHLVPLWYSPDGLVLRSWTYAKSQKAKNVERDPHATLQIEDGVLYHELRGAMFECDVEIEREPAEVEKFGLALFERYAELNPDVEAMVRAQAQKRVGLTFRPTRIVSWDHGKLGGTY
jgi:PPOX class probable F420-dependent enzyme